MKMKNIFALAILAVLVFGLAFAGEKTKKTTEAKKDGCCMEGKATKVSDTKKSESKADVHATNAKHEKGKGMDCTDDKECKEAHAANTEAGKDCCKEMTKAETDKKQTPAPKE